MADPLIQVRGVGKEYRIDRLRTAQHRTLREDISSFFRGKGLPRIVEEPIWALRNIDLDIHRGESFALIGPNGSGKSTLLKILARVVWPTEGKLIINGRIGALLEVGTGFHGDLTGRENIYLCGAILGMKRREISQYFDEIVDFSGIEDFLEVPVKRYSSGMFLRLAFSVMTHLKSEILIADEVLAVGDKSFQEKSLRKMEKLVDEGRTVIFVSHDQDKMRQLCSRALLLDHGLPLKQGPIDEVLDLYEEKTLIEV